MKQIYMFFWNSLAFSMIQQMLTIWFLVPLPFLNPDCTSGSSWFTYCWSLTGKDFEHYFASTQREQNCAWVWTLFGIALLWDRMITGCFQFCVCCRIFQICWHIECSTFTASSFRTWNSSTGIPSPPLSLFIVMLPKAHLTLHSRMSDLGWWSHHRDYLGCEDLFCIVLLCILATSS